MSKIGSFGDIIFEISSKKIKTFKDFERSGSARWEKHEINYRKPKLEFIGPDLETITYTILFKAELGINPIKEIEKLRKMRDTGKVASFIIGGKSISSNQWAIKDVRETNNEFDNKGNLLRSVVEVDLEEYYIKPKTATKKATTKTVKKKTTTTKTTTSKKKVLGKITITVKSVNIRSGPSTSHKVIGWAMKNDKFTVYSVKSGWYSLGNGKYISANSAYSTLKKG